MNRTSTSSTVDDVRITLASEGLRRAGLLSFASVIVGGWMISGIAIRVSITGRRYVSWPVRRSQDGTRHLVAIPIDASLKARIEAAVLREHARATP